MDTNLVKLIEQFGSEERCRTYLEELRWPDGPRCPKCNGDKLSRFQATGKSGKERFLYQCIPCSYQFSVTTGTAFHDSHLPLWKWFLAAYAMCESKKGVSALQLKRMLGVGYKTSWYLCHRIRAAMANGNGRARKLTGEVEIDETYIGPRRTPGIRGRGARKKTPVLGIVKRGGEVRMQTISGISRDAMLKIIQKNVSPEVAAIYTDELSSYNKVRKAYPGKHKRVRHASEWVHGRIHTNTIESAWSLLKRSIVGSYHKVSRKHLPAYLEEIGYRYNNRQNPRLFQLTLRRLLQSPSLPFDSLTGKG